MLFLGCDPDMHSMSFAAVDETLAIRWVGIVRVPDTLKEQDAAIAMIQQLAHYNYPVFTDHNIMAGAVEAQEIYLTGPSKTKNPRSILHLGNVAGAGLAVVAGACIAGTVYFPTPVRWKGSRDKLPHHWHILNRAKVPASHVREMGGKEPYCSILPSFPIIGAEELNPGDWKHVLDAVGLAQYAAETWLFQDRKTKLLNAARSSGNNQL